MQRVLKVVCAAAATLAVAACTDYDSETDLNPEGPPMVQQVRLRETYTLAGSTSTSDRIVFAFGSHDMATEMDMHPVMSATATGNKLRIIVDELLVGNNLEEIACRGQVDDDAYATVPLGATPDDIARCSAAQDVLPATCTGELAVCMCKNAAGCLVGSTMIAEGAPVGVLDINQDGATDDTRMMPGAVGLRCGAVDVPIDLDMSYWNPSGNQQVPAMGGFDALGPAIVLVPQRGLPTNLDCNLTFSSAIVDKQGEQLCAPPNGDIGASCTPGDFGAFRFKVEPLTFESASFMDGGTGVSRLGPALFLSNTVLNPSTIANITMSTGGAPFTAFTVTQAMTPAGRNFALNFTPPACATCPATGLAANTTYTITIPTTVTDSFGQGAPMPVVITFTTGA
jgi:hypothetical protein